MSGPSSLLALVWRMFIFCVFSSGMIWLSLRVVPWWIALVLVSSVVVGWMRLVIALLRT